MSELQPILDQLKVPAPDRMHTERALERALIALRNTPKTERKSQRTFCLWITAAATACVALALVLLSQHEDASTKVFVELENLFPGQLLAVIRSGDQTDLRLSALPNPELASDQRIRITIRADGATTDIFTYSGRRVCIPLKSGSLCLTPLLTGEGDVLVLTDDKAFAGSGTAQAATIRATALTSS